MDREVCDGLAQNGSNEENIEDLSDLVNLLGLEML